MNTQCHLIKRISANFPRNSHIHNVLASELEEKLLLKLNMNITTQILTLLNCIHFPPSPFKIFVDEI